MLRRAILVISGWPHDPDDLGLQPFGAGCFALSMAHDVRPVTHRDLPPSRGLGAGISGHGHIGFGRHHRRATPARFIRAWVTKARAQRASFS
jgi:hypothetical protein